MDTEITVTGLTIANCNDIERKFTIAETTVDGDIITTCGHRIGWDWDSNLGTVVWTKSGRRLMHAISIK